MSLKSNWKSHRVFFGIVLGLALGTALCLSTVVTSAAERAEPDRPESEQPAYADLIRDDDPVAWWRFDQAEPAPVQSDGSPSQASSPPDKQTVADARWPWKKEGRVQIQPNGPGSPKFPLFGEQNSALILGGSPRGFLRVTDPGPESPLDFQIGDAVTLEAWVRPHPIPNNQQVYIVGKGRTQNPGFRAENQNYALRLRSNGNSASVSFLFRNAATDEYHRWNTRQGVAFDSGWHHVAITYVFGDGKSIRGYIDGQEVAGSWDMGGPTNDGPVVDDDELWIGSSLGGSSSSTFRGGIDEVAIYRRALSVEDLGRHYQVKEVPPPSLDELLADAPEDVVGVEIFEGIVDAAWPEAAAIREVQPTERFDWDAVAMVALPHKYSARAVRIDRSNPFLLRLVLQRHLPAGKYEFLLRAKNASRLYCDGRLVEETAFMNRNGSGHESVPDLSQDDDPQLWPLAAAHQEQRFELELTQDRHHFELQTIVGGKGMRAELGELCVAFRVASDDKTAPFLILTPHAGDAPALTTSDWPRFEEQSRWRMVQLDQEIRRRVGEAEAKYWSERHRVARQWVEQLPPLPLPADVDVERPGAIVDALIDARLEEAQIQPARLTSDLAFLRRLSLDTVGVLPSRHEITLFLNDAPDHRRQQAIDRYLDDPRWADHWVSYWQDVLAENPGILKPKLNNSGPFRWWIHESFLDNKPMDRFVTELVRMEGSVYEGAPAGFSVATQNDVPMAAKAHVLGQAFLAMEMKCARCHDAPYHDFQQQDLFELAAMLQRKPIALPKSSTVPVEPGGREPLVTISLKPGASLQPQWPFAEQIEAELPAELILPSPDSRERLAAIITSPRNSRFAKVMVNRLWQRWLGQGFVEPVDDWQEAEGSHEVLLEYLAREFVRSGYDLKHVARRILNSRTYQREAGQAETKEAQQRFASPRRRRLTAEQIVDSLFLASGKRMNCEPLTLDPEGRRTVTTFLNLGAPRRAWEFTSLSNERDRPALALPRAQTIVDVLIAYGWRDARPNPLTTRDEQSTLLQPLTLANGIVVHRVAQLSEDHSLTGFVTKPNLTLDELVDELFMRLLTRRPTERERTVVRELLAPGFEDRRVQVEPHQLLPPKPYRTAVSWSNHLNEEATRIKMELEQRARQGDPPTPRLRADWRERAEDAIWALVNSPEFIFVP